MRHGVNLQTEVPQAGHRERPATIADPRSGCEPTTRQFAFIEELRTVVGFGLADFDRWLGRFGVDRVTALDRDGARKVIGALLTMQRQGDPQKVGAKWRISSKRSSPRCGSPAAQTAAR
jgi:hypothetical protein